MKDFFKKTTRDEKHPAKLASGQVVLRSISHDELKEQAKIFIDRYGEVIKKLSQE